jgi:hypothetical protein
MSPPRWWRPPPPEPPWWRDPDFWLRVALPIVAVYAVVLGLATLLIWWLA